MATQDQYLRQDVVATGDVTLGDDTSDLTTITGSLVMGDVLIAPPSTNDYGPGPLTNEVIFTFPHASYDAATVTVVVVDDVNDDLYMASFNIAHIGGAATLSSAYGVVDAWGGTNPTFNVNYGGSNVELRMNLADSVSASVAVDSKLYSSVESPEITITLQPTNETETAPAPATFNLTATSNDGGTLSYQWEVSSDGGSTWANATGGVYSGDTTVALQVTNTTGLDTYQYRCVVSSSGTASDVTSSAGVLTVL